MTDTEFSVAIVSAAVMPWLETGQPRQSYVDRFLDAFLACDWLRHLGYEADFFRIVGGPMDGGYQIVAQSEPSRD